MKQMSFVIIISIAFTFCNSLKPPFDISSDSLLTKNIIRDTIIELNFNAEKKMTVFADSLNNLSMEDSLPSFLYDECFDWKTAYWPDIHHPISLRQLIVNKVSNRVVVEKILKSENPSLRKLCNVKSSLTMPNSQMSFYELFKLRYAEL